MTETEAYADSLAKVLADELRTTFCFADSEESAEDELAADSLRNVGQIHQRIDECGCHESPCDSVSHRIFTKAFCWHAHRIFDYTEDFGSLLVLELYKDGLIGMQIERRDLHRILTRIRKRIIRELRESQLPDIELKARTDEKQRSDIADALLELDARETLIAEELLKRRTVDNTRKLLNVSRSEYYRQRSTVKEKLKSLLEARPDSREHE